MEVYICLGLKADKENTRFADNVGEQINIIKGHAPLQNSLDKRCDSFRTTAPLPRSEETLLDSGIQCAHYRIP